jgi:hypothetical protein
MGAPTYAHIAAEVREIRCDADDLSANGPIQVRQQIVNHALRVFAPV